MMSLLKTLILLALIFLIACTTRPSAASTRPNVLIIYADDLGYGDVSAYHSGTLKTPNIDRLATGGVRFTQGYAASATCTPSRFALLTGSYPWRNKNAKVLPGDAPLLIDTAARTLADIFKSKEYSTAVIGKWHLGLGSGVLDWNVPIASCPNDLGFDYSYIMAATNDRVPCVFVENRSVDGLSADDPLYVSYKENFEGEPTALTHPELMTRMKWEHGHNQSVHNGIPRIGYMKGGRQALWHDEDMADRFLDKTKTFIQQAKDDAKPFFLYYALHEPHVPRIPNSRFEGLSGMGPRGDAILEADWCVGSIYHFLDSLNLLDNTLILFSSDNGPVLNDGYYDQAEELIGDHTPAGIFRGGKYSLFEGGTRIPFITYWRNTLTPQVSDAIVSQIDLCASLAALIGATAFDHTDSENHLDVLMGQSHRGRSQLIEEAIGRLAYRQGDWLIIPPHAGAARIPHVNNETGASTEYQLYNLRTDPGQKMDLATTQKDTLSFLKSTFLSLVGTDRGYSN